MDQSGNNHGGKRVGAGRKPARFKMTTKVIRVPEAAAENVKDFVEALKQKRVILSLDAVTEFSYPPRALSAINLPLFSSKVPAGLPSSADDHVEKRLDPNGFLIDDQASTFFVTIQGYSMLDAGLLPGDKAVIDRGKIAKMGDIVLAMVDGEFTIKQLGKTKSGQPRLLPANASGEYLPIEINANTQFEIWGVVTGSFRRFR